MPDVLWIGEKKTLVQAVASVLPGAPEFDWDRKGLTHNRIGDQWFVWLDGHAFEQAMPDHYLPDTVPTTSSGRKVWRKADLPVVPGEWVLFPKDGKQARLDKLRELLGQVDVVHHLGDPDEEGQVIVDEALLQFGNHKPVKRVLVNDYNATKVRQALANVRDNAEPMFRGWYRWGLARSRYDWLFGLNFTRAMTLRGRELGFDGLLPVGSVQTPLLYIVRERDRAIEEFKPIPYFSLVAQLKHANGTFKAAWKPGDDQQGLDESGRLVDAGVASALAMRLSGKSGTISAYSKAKKEKKAPLPLSMNELQIEGFDRFGYTGQQVLDAGQKLYETYKVATYPRSDNRYLSEAQHKEAPAILAAVFKLRPDLAGLSSMLSASRKSDAFNDKRMEGTAHHGIVPTVPEVAVNMSAWSDVERNVYELIVKFYLAQFAPPFEYMHTEVEARIDGERFATSGKTPVAPGWKAIFGPSDEQAEDQAGKDDAEGKDEQTLPPMVLGDSTQCVRCDQVSRKTTPPDRFDDKLLLEAMMNVHKYVTDEKARKRLKDGDGIGTTATRAGIIQDLKERGLIVPLKEGSKKLMTSSTARTLIDALPMEVKDPAQAGVFKARLDQVGRGDLPYDAFMAETAAWVTDVVRRASSLSMKLPLAAGVTLCTKCGAGVLKRKEGEKGSFWYCANWNREPEPCAAKYQDVNGKVLATPIACPTCKTGELRWKKREGASAGAFWFCSNWKAEPKCSASFEDKAGKPDLTPRPKCPTCKLGELRRHVRDDKSAFWSCSRWNAETKCPASFDDKLGKPDTTPKPIIKCPKCQVGQLRSIRSEKGPFWGCNRYEQGCKNSYPDKAGRPDFTAKRK